MTNKVTIATIALIGVLAFGIGYLSQPKVSLIPSVGSVTGPSVDSPFFEINGVTKEYRSQRILTGTTTPCSIKAPGATSTLLYYTMAYNRASADGATLLDLTLGTTAFATTSSQVGSANTALATGPVQGVLIVQGTTTPIVSPNAFVVAKVASSSLSANFSMSGVCKAVFQVL